MYNEIISAIGVVLSVFVAYGVAKYVLKSERKRSKSLLLSACIRFYTASMACTETGRIKSDKTAKTIYISELKDIKNMIERFLGSQYYSDSYLKIPEVSIVATQLNHEIYHHENVDSDLKLNERTIELFSKIYEKATSRKLKNEKEFLDELKTVKNAFDEKIHECK